ncbi:MAG TPA: response regulator [Spirochaetia bacterium]|nr:response regulator [Spirochaetia bacterium]
MYRVVIVDDEEPVLDSFAFILEKESEDFALCGKARSGTEAIRIINELKPDLVFMDIQMPGIDGIDAITQLRIENPEIVFILATAYERFDVAQKAIPLGVFSYLVKPISRKALIGELNRAKLKLDQSRQRASHQLQDIRFLQKTKEEMKNKFLGSLAWGNPTAEDWELFSRLFDLKCERGTIRLVGVKGELPPESREAILGKFRERVQYKFNCFHTTMAGRLLLFFPENQNLAKLDGYIQKLAVELAPIEIEIGQGEGRHYSELATCFDEAYRSFDDSAVQGKSYTTEKNEMQRICTAFVKADFERGVPLFDGFWMRIFREEDFELGKAKMVALFTLLWAEIDEPVLSAARMDLNPAEAIMSLRDLAEWRQWSSDVVCSLRKLLSNFEARALPQHLSKALSIIHEKYSQPIQLSSVAEECKITASYLCRLFSEHIGTSFVEYLTKYRIEQAIVLLRENSLSIKEASNLVGFQDPNYFSRIFRRYVGMSPSDLTNRRSQ